MKVVMTLRSLKLRIDQCKKNLSQKGKLDQMILVLVEVERSIKNAVENSKKKARLGA